MYSRKRRLLAGLSVAGALLAVSAAPATAQEADAQLDVYFNDTTVAAGSAGKIGSAILRSSEPIVLSEITMRYDYTDLAGTVTISDATFGHCESPEEAVLVCTEGDVGIDEWGLGGLFSVLLTPADDAQDGDAGTLKMSLSAPGFDTVTHEAKIRVGEGVDLAAGPPTEISAQPGGAFAAPLTMSNAGTTTAKGASVIFYNDYAMRATKHYSNCTYEGDELRTCQFTDELTPGVTYSAPLGYALAPDTYAPGFAFGETVWLTPAEFEDFTAYLDDQGVSIGEPGSDGELPLTSAINAQGVQADTEPDNNYGLVQITVTGENGTDLAAIGDELTGAVGAVVTATVGFRNNGPATLDHSRSDSSVTHMNVEIPAGTTVVEAPESCAPISGKESGEPGQPGGRQYVCYPTPFIAAGEQETIEFELQIDKLIENATGSVKINLPCQCDGGFYDDLNPANDVAKLLVNPTEGGQGGGEDGTLPITGTSTGIIAGVGALLLAAGVGGFVLARRRRTRFVA